MSAAAQHMAGGLTAECKSIDIAIVADGWSIAELLRGNIQNDLGEFVGYVHDVIVPPDDDTTFVIVTVTGFLKNGERLVAAPGIGCSL